MVAGVSAYWPIFGWLAGQDVQRPVGSPGPKPGDELGGHRFTAAAALRLRGLDQLGEEAPGVGAGDGGNLLGSADGDDLTAFFAALRAEVDQPVRSLDHVE